MKSYSVENNMWMSGWLLGKFDRLEQLESLPMSSLEARQWLEGFTTGTAEACLYKDLTSRIDMFLSKYPESYRHVKSISSLPFDRQYARTIPVKH